MDHSSDRGNDIPLLTTGDCILWDENGSEPDASRVRLNNNFEVEINREEQHFGNITHVWSTYESRRSEKDEKPFARGINSIQLMNDGDRWWILNIYWTAESPEHPIPEKYLPN